MFMALRESGELILNHHAPVHMWEAFQWRSGAEMQYLRTFAFSIGKRYQELVPLADLVSPNKTSETLSYEGWAYCARTDDKKIFLVYFEKGCPNLRSVEHNSTVYIVHNGLIPGMATWIDAGNGKLVSSKIGIIKIT